MKRPSFQFYPADWRNNANLRRCSLASRGAWIEVMGLLHDSDEYGILRWPLVEIASAAGVPIELLDELVLKTVFKGSNTGLEKPFTFTPRHARKAGATVVLIATCIGPCWFSSRMVTDEWIRHQRGGETRFKASPKTSPNRAVGDRSGDGPTSSSSSSLAERERDFPEVNGYPTEKEVVAYGQMIGLAEWKAKDWFFEMEGCGWLDHNKRPIQKWQSVLNRVRTKWEADGRPMAPPSRNGAGGEPLWKRRQIIQEQISKHPANRNSVFYNDKHTPEQRDELRQLLEQRRTLAQQTT